MAVAVSGGLISGCGLAIENITGGAVSRTWGGPAQAAAAFVLIWSAHAAGLARVMKPLIVVMFVSIVACAALTFREPAAVLSGLFVPAIPSGGGIYVLSLIGGIGDSLTLLSYNYLLRAEGKVDPRNLRAVRLDLALAYLFTAVFGVSVITDREAVSRMAGALAAARFCAVRVSRPAALDRDRIHDSRKRLHSLPRRDAALPEQSRRLPRSHRFPTGLRRTSS